MKLLRARLAQFRNLEAASIEFGPQFTVLHGHNGAGKTNILEAIYLVSTLRSFRTSESRALVRKGQPGARVDLAIHDPTVDLETELAVRIDIGERSTRRTASIDGKTVRAAADFYGRVRAILFTPEDLGVLRGSPTGRRQFLDRALFARDRAHIGDIQRYEKLLRSRNQVLKQGHDFGARDERERLLDTYDAELAQAGAHIWSRRTEVVEALRGPFATAFEEIHDGSLAAAFRYVSRIDPDAEASDTHQRGARLLAALQERRGLDLQRGTTSVGPHRDDLEFSLDGQAAATFASQGQSRAMILAFKIAELESGREREGHAPLLLLDDVSSELDPRRSARLFETLARRAGQCVLTTTAADYVSLGPDQDRRNVEVRAGELVPETPTRP